MVNKIKITIVLLLFCSVSEWAQKSYAHVTSGPAGGSVTAFSFQFSSFARLNNGRIASTWDELMTEREKLGLESRAGGPLDRRFTLFGDSGPEYPHNGRIVLITNDVIVGDREKPGRYVVVYEDGAFGSPWIPEELAKEIFQKAGIPLPQTGVWRQPSTDMNKSFVFIFLIAAAGLVVIVLILRGSGSDDKPAGE